MTNLEVLAAAIKLHTSTDSNKFSAIAEALAQSTDGTDKQEQSTAIYTLALPQPCAVAK